MHYLLLIYVDEAEYTRLAKPELEAISHEYVALTEDLKRANAWIGGNRLKPIATATTVRVRDGKPQLTDGPFAETREQLGGYYLVDAPGLDEAVKYAARIPAARIGSVEVRPIHEM